jgi:hypothetical protein
MRNLVAKNAVAAGARAQTHRDRKRLAKLGYKKHKKKVDICGR